MQELLLTAHDIAVKNVIWRGKVKKQESFSSSWQTDKKNEVILVPATEQREKTISSLQQLLCAFYP